MTDKTTPIYVIIMCSTKAKKEKPGNQQMQQEPHMCSASSASKIQGI